MTQPSPSLLDAIAEVCKWHGLVQSRHPSRVLRDGGRQEILPPEIPQAIRNGEIPVPEELRERIFEAVLEAKFEDWPKRIFNRELRSDALHAGIDPVINSREIE